MQSRRQFLRLALIGLPALAAGGAVAGGSTNPAPASVDLSILAGKVELMPRDAWTDSVPERSRVVRAGKYDRITVHHQGGNVSQNTGIDAVGAQINHVLTAHRHLGYGDIGYHFIVDYAGRVWEGRSLAYWGAHVSGGNEGNIGVMALGNFEEQKPSEKQTRAVAAFVGGLRRKFGVEASWVLGHRDLGHTLCPGRNLYPVVLGIRGKE